MGLDVTSLAAAVGVGAKNVQFEAGANVLPRKILIIGTFDPSILTVAENVPARSLSSADAGDKYGFGTMLHRLALQVERGARGIETWIVPQEEAAGNNAAGSIAFSATDAVAGTIYLYISNELVKVAVGAGDTADTIGEAVEAAVNADRNIPVTAVNTTGTVVFTSVSKGLWGNGISLAVGNKGETLPTGISVVVTDMTGGSGVPDIQDALDALGTDEAANEEFFTDVVHGYMQDVDTLDAIANYVGQGNEFIGLYDKLIHRPFRCLTGDIVAGSSGLDDLITLADDRLLDRANGIIVVPGSLSHPSEIAAQTIGHMARLNQNRAEEHYIDVALIDVHPGAVEDRWTGSYDNRDLAVKSGISPTRVKGKTVMLQNVVTFYRPDSVSVSSNGYRSMRNISILQNILYNVALNFEREKWKGVSIVNDVQAVTNTVDREKARDIGAVIDDLVSLAVAFEGNAWLFTADYTIGQLKIAGAVSIRSGTTGFDSVLKIILSGEGGIFDTEVQFDTSIAVLM